MVITRGILEISCKVLGLFFLVKGIPYISSMVATVTTLGMMKGYSLTFTVSTVAFHYVAAFVLLKWARGIASLLLREDQSVELRAEQGWQKSIYTLCLRVVGAVAIVEAVPAIIRTILQLIIRYRSSQSGATTSASWILLISFGAHLALGIYFIGGAKEVVKIALKGSMRERDSNDA